MGAWRVVATGLSRATLLKRGALGGGALLVSASGVSAFAGVASAGTIPDADLAYLPDRRERDAARRRARRPERPRGDRQGVRARTADRGRVRRTGRVRELMAKQQYTASEAAAALGISVDTLRRWDRAGRIRVKR